MLNRRSLLKLIGYVSPVIPLAGISALPSRNKEHLEILHSHVAGFQHYQEQQLVSRMQPGDALLLKREPDNRYDASAIEIYWNNNKIGYVPRVNNSALCKLMDQGRQVRAEIGWLAEHPWQPVGLVVSVVV